MQSKVPPKEALTDTLLLDIKKMMHLRLRIQSNSKTNDVVYKVIPLTPTNIAQTDIT